MGKQQEKYIFRLNRCSTNTTHTNLKGLATIPAPSRACAYCVKQLHIVTAKVSKLDQFSTSCLCFEKTLLKSERTVEVKVPIGEDIALSVTVQMLNIEIPPLIALSDLSRERPLLNYIENKLIGIQNSKCSFPITYKHGHIFVIRKG